MSFSQKHTKIAKNGLKNLLSILPSRSLRPSVQILLKCSTSRRMPPMSFSQTHAKIANYELKNLLSIPPSRSLRPSVQIFLTLIFSSFCAKAEVTPVSVRVSAEMAWIGQRVPFFVELRSPGSFAGSASFDLPEIPGAMVMKIGTPSVSSEEIEGKTWFVQSHEFALFSQKPGSLEIPTFTVRFSQREGFSGPANDVRAESPGFKITLQRPAGSENIPFLVTTESLDITETWEPAPGSAEFGAVFKRTIIQRAPQVPGMALVPSPTAAPEGIRVYPGSAETNDKLDRGDFLGERRETITYMMQKSGTLEIPALDYVWWNPKTEALESKTLTPATFEIAPQPATQSETGNSRRIRPGLMGIVFLIALMVWQKNRLANWAMHAWKTLNPPHRVAARKLLSACRQNNVSSAATAWNAWLNTQDSAFQPTNELRAAVIGLQRQLFGSAPTDTWRGKDLARVFSLECSFAKARSQSAASSLPPLNAR
jgi:hypothetical protein